MKNLYDILNKKLKENKKGQDRSELLDFLNQPENKTAIETLLKQGNKKTGIVKALNETVKLTPVEKSINKKLFDSWSTEKKAEKKAKEKNGKMIYKEAPIFYVEDI